MTRPATRVWRAALVLVLLLAVAFALAAPPERCPSVSAAELRRSAQSAADWLVRNQNPDGTWLYLYDRRTDSAADEYNSVRHAGAVMALYQAAAAGLPGALRSADLGTEWALQRLLERDGWAAVDWEGRPEVETGTTALLVAGLVIRREATGDPRYDAVMAKLGRFLVAQSEPSGAVLASFDPGRGGRCPASTRSTTRARPTGPSLASTAPSRTTAGARQPIALARTWRHRATRWRVTGRRSPIIGLPTAWPTPCTSLNVAGRLSPGTSLHTRAVKPSCSGAASAGSLRSSGRGASS